MINFLSLHAFFRRYSALHRSILLRPRKINRLDGQLLARIEGERIRGNMRCLRGWTFAQRISVMTSGRVVMTISPTVARGDVQAVYGGQLQSGFELQVPASLEQPTISFTRDGDTVTQPLHAPSVFANTLETLRLAVSFTWAAARGLSAIQVYLRSDDTQARDAAKKRLKSLFEIGRKQPPRDHLFGVSELGIEAATCQPAATLHDRLTIVLPVYNAFDLLCDCLNRIANHTDLDWHLILIEDCSTDERIRPFLHSWAAKHPAHQITFLTNDTNLGFIASTNRGMAEALPKGAPIALLNSDALVPVGWASRLVAPFADADVATTTPFSNDAEILNAPAICQRSICAAGIADKIDAQAKVLLANSPPVPLPTGVGFCMGISADWLARVPQLDTIFGRGYGEEVDWCQKIRKLGGRHVAVPDLFVEHRGGESFGAEDKKRLIQANGRIVTERYPDFDAEVQEFIASDPLIGPRLIMGLLFVAANTDRPVPVYLCHSLGGGAEDAMLRQIDADLQLARSSVVLRVGGRFRYGLELHTPQGVSLGQTDEDSVIEHILRALPQRHIIYVCGVGDLDAASLPERLIGWSDAPGASLTIEFHDFFPISPSYTLLDSAGHFSGPPKATIDATASPSGLFNQDRTAITLIEWQRDWQRALARAEDVIVFSESSRAIIVEVWPEFATKIRARPHPLIHVPSKVKRAPQMPARTIGVLGNIGHQKGAQVLQQFSNHLSNQKGERLVVIGNIDPNYPLSSSALVHGSYAREDVTRIAESYEIDCWLIPSIWPETFSFTTHEALATGLPVWCFDLGAQAEALSAAGQSGHVLPLPVSPADYIAFKSRILTD